MRPHRLSAQGRSIPLTAIPYGSDEWKRFYRGRGSVEREFGTVEHDYGLARFAFAGLRASSFTLTS